MKQKRIMAIWIFGNFIVYQANMVYFGEAEHAYDINEKGHSLVNLGHIDNESSVNSTQVTKMS